MPHFRTLTEISYELAQTIPPLYQRGPIFFLTQSEKEARQLQDLCVYWQPDFPIETIISPHTTEHQSISEADYAKRILTLQPGPSYSITQLVSRLTELGFERFPRAISVNSFAVRGNIVDIVDRKPVRIEYDDNTIVSLSIFDVASQATLPGNTHQLTQLTLWPKNYSTAVTTWHEHDLTYQFVTPKYYHKRIRLMQADMQKMLTVLVATKDEFAVEKLLPQAKFIAPKAGLEGFSIPSEHLVLLTDSHIFGHEETLAEFESELTVSDLTPGEYVVHIDHGVALFDGMREIDGEQYMVLLYAKNDKLFVPQHQIKRVELYLGEEPPKLTRLSTADWEQVVREVTEDVQQTAKELLDLHAQRQVAQATHVSIDAHEDEIKIANDVEFALTPDQEQAIADIFTDIDTAKAMNRLLCGDVGFGKTEVALRAAAHIVLQANSQVAILAPTTVLAQQHYETFQQRLAPYGIHVELLSRLQTKQQQVRIVEQTKAGNVDILIGTHRLLSKDVQIPKLALVVIDEEQRFGVKHKERFKGMRAAAHVLTMTATPIPRTLNLALSGVEDISVLNTAPILRKPIITQIDQYDEAIVHAALQEEFDRDGQIYYVHNNLQTIHFVQRKLQKRFPDKRLEVAHGQMAPTALIRIMRDFHNGAIDGLIASTIIENGLDISNANTLVIDHAERFGLAQLYQLRGRVGRGDVQAYAYMLYHADSLTPQAQKRLKALHAIKELGGGFELAMKDLEIRGVGDILGKKQHGRVQQVGLNLYTRLLQQAIESLQAEQA